METHCIGSGILPFIIYMTNGCGMERPWNCIMVCRHFSNTLTLKETGRPSGCGTYSWFLGSTWTRITVLLPLKSQKPSCESNCRKESGFVELEKVLSCWYCSAHVEIVCSFDIQLGSSHWYMLEKRTFLTKPSEERFKSLGNDLGCSLAGICTHGIFRLEIFCLHTTYISWRNTCSNLIALCEPNSLACMCWTSPHVQMSPLGTGKFVSSFSFEQQGRSCQCLSCS